MNRSRPWYKNLVLVLMLIMFILLATTGLLKMRSLMSFIALSQNSLPIAHITTIHDWSGLLFIVLLLMHLIIQRGWFSYAVKSLLSPKGRKMLLLFVFGMVLGLLSFLLVTNFFGGGTSEEVKKLEAVEVKNYKGEDLSSISDFRENSIKGPQYIDKENYSLKVSGLVQNELNLSYDKVLKNESYEKAVTLHCVEGWSVKILWEGVLLEDILKDAVVKDEANTVIFRAYDGYSTSLSLDYILDNQILIAYKINGVELPPERGFPFQLVAEDKWGYKWAKWITGIEISDDESFRGYWEKGGYNQDGDVTGPKFEE